MNDKKHDKGHSIQEKLKEGFSVQEIESFARKHTNEGLLILAIFVAAISSMFHFFSGAGWSIAFIALTAIISLALPEKTMKMLNKLSCFFNKSEKTIQILIGIVRIILALFFPFLIFGALGLLAGTTYHYYTSKECHKKAPKKEEHKPEENDEEHL